MNKLGNYEALIKQMSSNYFFYTHDTEGVFKHVSDSATQMLGYTQEEFLKHFNTYLTDSDINKQVASFTQKSINGVQQPPYLVEIKAKNGQLKYLEIYESPVFNTQGNVTAVQGIAHDITYLRSYEQEIQRLEDQLNQTQSVAKIGFWEYYPEEERMIWSDGMYTLLEYDKHNIPPSVKKYLERLDPSVEDTVFEKDPSSDINYDNPTIEEHLMTMQDERHKMFQIRAHRLSDNEHTPFKLFGSIQDITEQHNYQKEIQERERFLQAVIDSYRDPVMVIDKSYTVKMRNESAQKNLDERYIANMSCIKCYELSHKQAFPCNSSQHPCPLTEAMKQKKSVEVMHIHYDKQGNEMHVLLSATPYYDKEGNIEGVIEVAKDITEQIKISNELKLEQNKLELLSSRDSLTSLPNRVVLLDRIEQVLKNRANKREKIALMVIDLDRFKQINDSLGHHLGDRVLQLVARRLIHSIDDAHTISRLGGDEFAILFDVVGKSQALITHANNLMASFNDPFKIDDHEFYVTISIGISIFPQDGTTAEELLKNADAALFRAKDEGRNTFEFYTQDMTESAFEHIFMQKHLIKALQKNEFELFYQPKISLSDDSLVGFEALIRWRSEDIGLVSPLNFIPIAEEMGLIHEIGNWVLVEACYQYKKWKQEGLEARHIAVNISGKQLSKPEPLLRTLDSLKQDSTCELNKLEFEINENFIMVQPEKTLKLLNNIRQYGIDLSIDDFGTGQTSLGYIKKLPISKLKIDRSFIQYCDNDSDDAAIIRAIIALSNSLGLESIAEGVETLSQKEFLINSGCKQMQGYYYSKPLDAASATTLLKKLQT